MMYVLACETCQMIEPDALIVDGIIGDYGGDVHPFAGAHDNHRLTLLTFEQAELTVPAPGWRPRPAYGPPLPGHAQDVVCPLCEAHGGSGPQDQIVWKRTTAGDPFLFCRACGYTWGPGADAERQRSYLRSMGGNHAR